MALGVPLIVNTPAEKLPVTPAGKPVTPAPVPPPLTEYVIFVMAVPTHLLCTFVPPAEVNVIAAFGFTVKVYVAVAATHGLPFGLLLVTVIVTILSPAAGVYVKLNGELVAEVMFSVPFPFSDNPTFVALPPNVLPLMVIGVPMQVLPLVLLKLTVGWLAHPQLLTVILPVALVCVQLPVVVTV